MWGAFCPRTHPRCSVTEGFSEVFDRMKPVAGRCRFQRVEKVFSPRCAAFETFKNVSKAWLIKRAVGFLPPRTNPPLLCHGRF